MGTAMALEGRSLAIFIVSIVMMTLSIATVSLRTFVRLKVIRAFGWDDASMITAMWWWLGQMLYVWTSAAAKISIALALLRLTIRRSHRIILWCTTIVTISIGLMFWLLLLFDCWPISFFWRQVDRTSQGKCLSKAVLLNSAYVYSSLTILCDLTLGILPAFLVWRLQMNCRTKLAVGGIFSLGALASVAVAGRVPFLRYYSDQNFLYSTWQIAIWSVVETGLGITAGSLITLRPLFRWLLDENSAPSEDTHQEDPLRQYPLRLLSSDGLKKSQDTKYWRPDIDLDDTKGMLITVSSPRRKKFSLSNSSQEALHAEPSPTLSPNRVTVQKTFIHVVSERPK
ncbi:unnamed protein product [Penicillium salamii]|uniref:Rhodopsin domain-containing protein n=1 Tax=Penicillium salamii TaxID=1612424 RepID=A0A9W4J9H3_9EURO|nr:unnamed protein product [Penicillium salamii]CAG8125268.1 unnamed protein product [Penicillium salamii]CAG8224373.1 unnamed protein product [Penicillium salamii]CAG8305640.1 unnamed protein product [Penicillium salamii]CAG8327672.1 unnamed protein product [Penicillium salamii]